MRFDPQPAGRQDALQTLGHLVQAWKRTIILTKVVLELIKQVNSVPFHHLELFQVTIRIVVVFNLGQDVLVGFIQANESFDVRLEIV